VTKEIALYTGDPLIAYAAAKKYAELALWEWAEAHPDIDVTTSKPIITFVVSSILLKRLCFSLTSPPPSYLRSIPTEISSVSEA
jgi:hypothetical protein